MNYLQRIQHLMPECLHITKAEVLRLQELRKVHIPVLHQYVDAILVMPDLCINNLDNMWTVFELLEKCNFFNEVIEMCGIAGKDSL